MATVRDEQPYELPEIIELSVEQGREMFDRQARKTLGMSGEEFLQRWDAGEFTDPDQPDLIDLIFLIPFTGRPINVSNER